MDDIVKTLRNVSILDHSIYQVLHAAAHRIEQLEHQTSNSTLPKEKTMSRKQDMLHAVRLHDRQTENDPVLATLMYSTQGSEGPWHDMATGHPDYIWELLEIVFIRNEIHRLRELCDTHNIDWVPDDHT
jgi:hypothetical protein